MGRNTLPLSITLLTILLGGNTYAQKIFSVDIDFPPQLARKMIEISYDNGIEEVKVAPVLKKRRLLVSGEYYSKFASLKVRYQDKVKGTLHIERFFLGEIPATIAYLPTSNGENPLSKYKTNHAYSHKSMGEEKYSQFIGESGFDLSKFLMERPEEMNDSLVAIASEKYDKFKERKIAFITQNTDLYYTFWLFRAQIIREISTIYERKISQDSLLKLFELFPDSLKQSQEGKRIVEILQSSRLKKGQLLPQFTATDIAGNAVSLDDFRGKFVLINFWAVWCGPCMAEMPTITAARKRYPADKLAMIFLAVSTEEKAFKNAVKTYNMVGTHIFPTNAMLKKYSATTIPIVYLIDPEGRIVYSREEEEDCELQTLEKVLTDLL